MARRAFRQARTFTPAMKQPAGMSFHAMAMILPTFGVHSLKQPPIHALRWSLVIQRLVMARPTRPVRITCMVLRWGKMKSRPRENIWNGRMRLRSEEHTSELQSLMRISYAVFCLKKKKITTKNKEYSTQYYRIKKIDTHINTEMCTKT